MLSNQELKQLTWLLNKATGLSDHDVQATLITKDDSRVLLINSPIILSQYPNGNIAIHAIPDPPEYSYEHYCYDDGIDFEDYQARFDAWKGDTTIILLDNLTDILAEIAD